MTSSYTMHGIRVTPTLHKRLDVKTYDFPERGIELPAHAHDENTNHITVVARGSFRVTGKRDGLIVKAGDILDWEVDEIHGLIALEPDSRLVNIVK